MVQSDTLLAGNFLEQVYVALDLETTGLDPARDTIIEVGAVKFQGNEVIDTFQTFVNPGRPIPEFIQRLTGIAPHQVRRAPFFSSVAGELEAFLGASPIVGHNISFDLRFLDSHGLRLVNPSYDTWDLASILLPKTPEYSLAYLSNLLGVKHVNRHRAMGDAQATRGVFLSLLNKATELDPGLLYHIINLAGRSRWGIASLLAGIAGAAADSRSASGFGLTGLDLDHLATRLGRTSSDFRRIPGPAGSYLHQHHQLAGAVAPQGHTGANQSAGAGRAGRGRLD
jgi:DNA polymerase III epsilon subunit family exonuclease